MPAGAAQLPARHAAKESAGYTLVAIVIGIAILTILLAAVAPSISMIMRREREEELLFRGRQYARAIALFQRKFNRYPNSLKELYEGRPRSIRKLWKDPMCRCDKWHLLILGTAEASPTGAGGVARPGSGLGQPPAPPTPTPGPTSAFGQPDVQGPIVGVRSNVHKEALQQWRGHKYYDEWSFIAGDADATPFGVGPGGSPGPGPALPTPRSSSP
jgi:type II secretory pathway pseudopilin PulG